MAAGAILPPPTLEASDPLLAQARANCAARAAVRGETTLAESYERGEQDQGWGLRHEVNNLRGEAQAVERLSRAQDNLDHA